MSTEQRAVDVNDPSTWPTVGEKPPPQDGTPFVVVTQQSRVLGSKHWSMCVYREGRWQNPGGTAMALSGADRWLPAAEALGLGLVKAEPSALEARVAALEEFAANMIHRCDPMFRDPKGQSPNQRLAALESQLALLGKPEPVAVKLDFMGAKVSADELARILKPIKAQIDRQLGVAPTPAGDVDREARRPIEPAAPEPASDWQERAEKAERERDEARKRLEDRERELVRLSWAHDNRRDKIDELSLALSAAHKHLGGSGEWRTPGPAETVSDGNTGDLCRDVVYLAQRAAKLLETAEPAWTPGLPSRAAMGTALEATHRALGGDGLWRKYLPGSGRDVDLTVEVPRMAEQLQARAEAAEEREAALRAKCEKLVSAWDLVADRHRANPIGHQQRAGALWDCANDLRAALTAPAAPASEGGGAGSSTPTPSPRACSRPGAPTD